MVAFASADIPDGLDRTTGRLFGILRPPKSRGIDPLDARPYEDGTPKSIAMQTAASYYWYRAPDVTEGLRVQRGSILIGGFNDKLDRSETSMFLDVGSQAFNTGEGTSSSAELPIAENRQTQQSGEVKHLRSLSPALLRGNCASC